MKLSLIKQGSFIKSSLSVSSARAELSNFAFSVAAAKKIETKDLKKRLEKEKFSPLFKSDVMHNLLFHHTTTCFAFLSKVEKRLENYIVVQCYSCVLTPTFSKENFVWAIHHAQDLFFALSLFFTPAVQFSSQLCFNTKCIEFLTTQGDWFECTSLI